MIITAAVRSYILHTFFFLFCYLFGTSTVLTIVFTTRKITGGKKGVAPGTVKVGRIDRLLGSASF